MKKFDSPADAPKFQAYSHDHYLGRRLDAPGNVGPRTDNSLLTHYSAQLDKELLERILKENV